MTIFNPKSLLTALESALVAGLTAFSGSLAVNGGATVAGLKAAAIAGGLGVLYAFVKQLGAVQSQQAVTKVTTPKA